jgi:hypothetical protein
MDSTHSSNEIDPEPASIFSTQCSVRGVPDPSFNLVEYYDRYDECRLQKRIA